MWHKICPWLNPQYSWLETFQWKEYKLRYWGIVSLSPVTILPIFHTASSSPHILASKAIAALAQAVSMANAMRSNFASLLLPNLLAYFVPPQLTCIPRPPQLTCILCPPPRKMLILGSLEVFQPIQTLDQHAKLRTPPRFNTRVTRCLHPQITLGSLGWCNSVS